MLTRAVERVVQQARLTGESERISRLTTLAEVSHKRLEREIRHIALGVGWHAASVDKVKNVPLPCGDIDALLAKPLPDGCVLILLCEAKDVDMALYKTAGYAQYQKTLKHAQKQLEAKARWLLANWRDVCIERFRTGFDSASRVVLVKALVTRDYSPIEMTTGTFSVAIWALKASLVGFVNKPFAHTFELVGDASCWLR